MELFLPMFSKEATPINNRIAYEIRDGKVYYFQGIAPIFTHEVKDTNSFKIIMAQLYITGNATQAEINRVFGLNPINMKRWVKKYKENGLASFYIRKKTKKPHVMTEEIIKKAQELLNNGKSISETARDLDIKEDTLRKSIKKGIIHKMEKKRGTRK